MAIGQLNPVARVIRGLDYGILCKWGLRNVREEFWEVDAGLWVRKNLGKILGRQSLDRNEFSRVNAGTVPERLLLRH